MAILLRSKDALLLKCSYEENEQVKTVGGYTWNDTLDLWEFPLNAGYLQILKDAFPRLTLFGNFDDLPDYANPTMPVKEFQVSIPYRDQLRPYQVAGVEFLVSHKRALLGDDMGTGKTLQALTACEAAHAERTLVICPASVKYHWAEEIERWFPERAYQIVEGDRDKRTEKLKSNVNYLIVNYEVARIHYEELAHKWSAVVIDEVHNIKTRPKRRGKEIVQGKTTNAIRHIVKESEYFFSMTGSPILNKVDDLFSILYLIDPKRFGSYWRFVQAYCELKYNGFGWEVKGVSHPAELHDLLSQYMIRRLKCDVLPDLPEKTVQQVWVDLAPEHRRIYDEMKRQAYAKVTEEKHVSASTVIAQITRLKQICLDPRLMIDAAKDLGDLEGAKVDALVDIIKGTDQKVVVFSQFAKAIHGIQSILAGRNIPHVVITGHVTGQAREQVRLRFQNDPDCKVILVTTQAGGQGIELYAGSIAVFMDKLWVPKLNEQAQDRLHRSGQKNPVTIIELLARNTVEEYIEKLLAYKQNQSDMVVDGKDLVNLLQ